MWGADDPPHPSFAWQACAVDGDVVTVSYKGRLFSNQQQFGEVEGLPVKLGKGNLVKGFEEALLGRSKNSRFIVRYVLS